MPHVRRWQRVAISGVALAVLLCFIPFHALMAAMARVPLDVLGVSLMVFLSAHVVAALKWRMLQGRDANLPIVATLRAHFSGVLANLWLPGVVGGDVVRVGVVFRRSSRPAAVALASVVDRIIDSAALVTLALIGLIGLGGSAHAARRVFLAVLVAGAVGVVLLTSAYALVRKRVDNPAIRQLEDAVGLLSRRPAAVLVAFVLSAAIQATFVLVNQYLGRAVGVSVQPAVWFMAWPLSKIVALVPISAAGIGIREAAIVMLMRPFGASSDAIMASSLLWQGLLFTGGFLGWAVLSFKNIPAMNASKALQSSRD